MIRSALYLACCFALIPSCIGLGAQVLFDDSKPIVEIEWRGRANIGQDEFLDLIGIQVGDTLTRAAVRRSLEHLYLKGFFSQIRIDSTPIRDGLKLTYYTTPAALVQDYQISGNESVTKRQILERLRPQVGERFSEHRLQVSLEAFRQFYAEQGFPQATIAWRVETSDDLTKATILLDIREGPPLMIADLQLEGVTVFSVSDLLAQFKARIGHPLNTARLSGDLERLLGRYRRAGYLVVRIEGPHIEREIEHHTAAVTITVTEGPKIELEFIGNRHFSNKVLRDAVLVDALSGYSEDVLVDSAREMLDMYRQQGWHFATIRHQVEVSRDGAAVVLRFHITEGPRVTVEALRIVGHRTLPEAEIRAQFLTQPRGFWGMLSKGYFIEKQLDKDLEALQFLYRRRGFLRASVARELRFSEDHARVTIGVQIAEGIRTHLGTITIQGQQTLDETELRRHLTVQGDDPFDEVQAQEDLERLLAVYERRGYRDTHITLDRRFEDDGRSVNLTYHIDEGKPTVIGQIIVQGNYRTQLEVITRDLTFDSGDPLSLTKLFESRRKLSQLALFSRIVMDPRLEEIAGEQDVVIQVTERKPKALNFGAGYGSEDKLRGFVEFTHNNIAGMHRQFRLRAQASFREQRYLMSFREPRLFGSLTSSAVGLSRAEEERASFSVGRTSVQVGFERPFGERLRAFLTYSFDFENLFDVDDAARISEVDRGRLNISSFVGTLQQDSRDRIVDPRTGSLQRLTFEVADLLLGSEVSFFKLIATTQWFFPLPWETVGAISLQAGIGEAFGSTGEIPISRRYFLGGSNTVRGYDFERLGPTGADGTPTGGNVLTLTNLEWRVPLYKGFGIVLFTDIGNVYRAIDDFTPGKIKGSLGLGLRYNTPIGPARLDYGHKLAPEDNEATGRFHFSIGHAF